MSQMPTIGLHILNIGEDVELMGWNEYTQHLLYCSKENAVELFDWIVSIRNVRGSIIGDNGLWINETPKPKYFDHIKRILYLEDGTKYLIKKNTASNAKKIAKVSENILKSLPTN